MGGAEQIVVPIAGMIMVICVVVGVPIARAYARKLESRPHDTLPTGDVVTRLERIEQAIEAMATEVERISEGQRFTTKLLSDGRPAAALPVAPGATEKAPDGTILAPAARRT